jgi:hypothetical protein
MVVFDTDVLLNLYRYNVETGASIEHVIDDVEVMPPVRVQDFGKVVRDPPA